MAKTFAPQYVVMAKKLSVYGAKHAQSMQPSYDGTATAGTFSTLQNALAAFLAANPRAKEQP